MSIGSLFGKIDVETPKHRVLKKTDDYEIRVYPPSIRAEAEYEGELADANGSFRLLAGYIFGKNTVKNGESNENTKVAMTVPVLTEKENNTKVAMTAPVLTEANSEAPPVSTETTSSSSNKLYKMAFTMPSQYSKISDLPTPIDSRVKLTEVPEQTFATFTFSGFNSDSKVKTLSEKIIAALKQDQDVSVADDAKSILARYNPPWTLPFLRKNEILIPVTYLKPITEPEIDPEIETSTTANLPSA
ncbi:hypothetical protein G9A89_012131 [Geosiphon pyriformis]|nr:hypothetical protein G9A89_012131 [Geosiphon pyriformis]